MARKAETKKRERLERIPAGPRPAEDRPRRFRLLLLAIVVLVVAALAALAVFLVLASGSERSLRAAIVDQLESRTPNPAFVETATATLQEAGYSVDYYESEAVTVELFRDLPARDYDLVILRTHSAVPNKDLTLPTNVDPLIIERIMERIGDDVLLFTSERYDGDAYLEEQKALRLFPVVYGGESMTETYFAVASGFIQSSMRERFHGSTVILMGCSSLATEKTAAAFLNKGAEAVVGWSDTVTPSHTDEATQLLLRHLLLEKVPLGDAVNRTMVEMGPDPSFGAVMRSYP